MMKNTLFLLAVLCFVHETVGIKRFLFDNSCKEGERRWEKCYGCICKHEQHLECLDCHKCKGLSCNDQTEAPKTHAPHITHAPHATHAPHKTHAPVVTNAPHTSTCDIVAVFDAVARNQFVNNSRAAQCPNDGRHANDALVMTLCNAPVSSKWVEGEQVLLRNGTCSELAKPYTPVFYHPRRNVRQAGILISCDGNEIRVFHQECDTTPEVLHVKSEPLDNIYILTWT
ncbi:uncharacterized protein LOC143058062 [Mytilus galloprovincialis]|uniref:uncharacterized protein LOC143058062 n=1 Tax=Mytilus galloprovincialis TaxID=29158 RepID=UPI003F7C9192